MSADYSLPDQMQALVESYDGCEPQPVRFREPSWSAALDRIDPNVTTLLKSDVYTSATMSETFRLAGDRLVGREAIERVCRDLTWEDDEATLQAFTLMMAWGSGTSNARSLRYTPKALSNKAKAAYVLTNSARALRKVSSPDSGEIESVFVGFELDGIGPSFFTKWFAFAGHREGRDWQPLILDARVIGTLNRSLGVMLRDLADKRGASCRYAAYIRAMHSWARQLSSLREPVSASRLEWIMFCQNGRPIP